MSATHRPPHVTQLLDTADDGTPLPAEALDHAAEDDGLSGAQLTEVYDELDERGLSVEDDGHGDAEPVHFTPEELAVHTTDAVQLFLNEAGRYRLLRPDEEIELSK